jgi:protocatechuate 3,4-dioxygenase beta subunit
MSRIPEPDSTPDGPAYEGRLLTRPQDEVVDQGVTFDVRTLISRRGVLSLIGLGAGAVVLAACAADTSSSSGSTSGSAAGGAATSTTSEGEIPDETAGPYPGDGSNGVNVLEESGIVRSDIRSSLGGGTTAAGVPMTFTLTVLDMANNDAPFVGAAIYVWHCDAAGGYSMYSEGLENETYLRGVQVADANGQVTFTSIIPACYTGRWPHIHFEVYPDVDSIADSANAIATSQAALPEDVSKTVYALSEYAGSTANLAQVSLDSDNVFGDDGGELQLATVTGDVASGYVVALTARVDTATVPSAGAAPSGGGAGGRGAGGGSAPEGGGGPGGPGGSGGSGGSGGTPPSGAPTGAPSAE